ncbi:hypothetical protein DO021_19335 [Desulfobacter hydrogenophilus]|uniref:Sulfotransferase n=1 Tax=Desulfobacter hydrogenophilus TaxID=2291 RepID=A0A328F861_9BACT|nr:sulfotransferase [Desulfobacter hydrogenophilus]NDY73891.1 sulfotransferase [Desulfobacter hydrogenophilus]QBH13259.1 sulfotransferase [Desulfobacter hydrogenophilus]RAM00386.1 hypothetical protein DO021_19335 [Desulfobacter hydrogenophilus]
MKEYSIDRPIFVIGMDRSGTSVISEIMSLHDDLGWLSNYNHRFRQLPQLSFLNRITHIPHFGWYLRGKKRQDKMLSSRLRKYLPYCDEGDYTLWTQLCGHDFTWDFLGGGTPSAHTCQKVRDYIHTILKYQHRTRLIVKLTGPPRINFLSTIFPDAVFVHVMRDPRAVVASLMRVPYWKQKGGWERPFWSGLSQKDIRAWEAADKSACVLAAIQWAKVVEQTWQECESLLPEQFIEIKYEDFVASAFDTITALLSKCGLGYSRTVKRYIDCIGNVRNMNTKYRQMLIPSELDAVQQAVKKTAEKAGYLE